MPEITTGDVSALFPINTTPTVETQPEIVSDAPTQTVEQPAVEQVATPTTDSLPEGVTEIVEATSVETTVSQPQFNEEQYLRDNFGLSKEELAVKLKAEQQYKTDEGRLFDELRSKGVSRETIFRVAFADTSQMSELDKVKLDYQIKYPSLTEEKLNAVLEGKYHLGEFATEQDKLRGSAQLTIDAQEADATIAAHKATELAPNNSRVSEESQAIERSRIEQWGKSGAKQNVLNSVQKVPVKIAVELHGAQGLEKKNFNFDFKLSEADQKAVSAAFDNILTSQPLVSNEEGQAFMQGAIQKFVWAQYGEKINQAALTQQATILHNHYQKVFNNPSVPNQRGGTHSEKRADIFDHALNFVGNGR